MISSAPNLSRTRRTNAVALFQRYAEIQMAQGISPKGLEQAFAASLEISPSLWSQIKSSRPIGDKLARQIEQHASKSALWLDQEYSEVHLPDAAQERFIALAREVWQQSNAKSKRELMQALKLFKST